VNTNRVYTVQNKGYEFPAFFVTEKENKDRDERRRAWSKRVNLWELKIIIIIIIIIIINDNLYSAVGTYKYFKGAAQ